MSNETDGFFDEAQKTGAPGFHFGKQPGPHVVGNIVDMYLVDHVPYGKKEPKLDDDGNVVRQLNIILQTELRDWDGVNPDSDSMKKEDGTPRDPKEDTGLRALYAVPGTNMYSAIGRAIKEDGTSRNPQVGAKLMVQFHEDEDTGKGNPLKKFRAKYKAPAKEVDAGFEPETPAAKSEPKPEAKATKTVDEPPF